MTEPLREDWDVVVVGAGVAGAVAAFRLARRELAVLLVDKADWPRDKVCGGCVNAAALNALSASGLPAVATLGRPYTEMQLAARGRHARFPLPAGRAISRRYLDAALVDAAVDAGAQFLPSTHARLADGDDHRRRLELHRGDRVTVQAKLVLACDGLQSRLLNDAAEVAPCSRIGAGVVVAAPPDYRPGRIYMACGAYGYVGLVRVEGEQLNIGTALDPAWVKHQGGPAAAVAGILESAGLPAIDRLDALHWRGTPRLTRRHDRLGADRLLALGDAAGYVEPFTGEGMAWAVAGAAAIEPYAVAAVTGWRDELVDAWTARHERLILNRQRACESIAALLRHPRLVAGAVRLAAAAPMVAAPLTAWLNRDFKHHINKVVET